MEQAHKETFRRVQPSSGGCVLKQCLQRLGVISEDPAVFGRLCVETSKSHFPFFITPPAVFGRLCVETPYGSSVSCRMSQPSSGGCVLKQVRQSWIFHARKPAAFGRLCVETSPPNPSNPSLRPAAFGRLCVETFPFFLPVLIFPPAAFGRLCVETASSAFKSHEIAQPPSGGCVLKPRCIAG